MKTGIELIAEERNDQLYKHKRSVKEDAELNNKNQLSIAAIRLIEGGLSDRQLPDGWFGDIWKKMLGKSYKEKLIIAGALIAAEIDRVQYKS